MCRWLPLCRCASSPADPLRVGLRLRLSAECCCCRSHAVDPLRLALSMEAVRSLLTLRDTLMEACCMLLVAQNQRCAAAAAAAAVAAGTRGRPRSLRLLRLLLSSSAFRLVHVSHSGQHDENSAGPSGRFWCCCCCCCYCFCRCCFLCRTPSFVLPLSWFHHAHNKSEAGQNTRTDSHTHTHWIRSHSWCSNRVSLLIFRR